MYPVAKYFSQERAESILFVKAGVCFGNSSLLCFGLKKPFVRELAALVLVAMRNFVDAGTTS